MSIPTPPRWMEPDDEPDGCARWIEGDCECMPGWCDIDDEIAIRAAEYERDYAPTDDDKECES